MDSRKAPGSAEPRLTIGGVARATGLSPDTLRVWQKRYGFPVPQRKPSGHRLYSLADVRRLRRICVALSRGHRPGLVVPMAGPGLDALLGGLAQPLQAGPRGLAPIRTLLELVKNHEGALLSAALLADAAALGPIEFLRLCAIPMIEAVGEGWERGDLGVHHEHVFSERLADALRAIRLPHERGGAGPRITLAALAGETHGLGLQMAALVAAVAGLEPHVLGVDTPVADIVAAVRARKSAVLGISISVSTGGPGSRDQLAALRRGVAASTRILVGGRGARRSHPPGGCVIVDDLASFYDSMRRLGSARAS